MKKLSELKTEDILLLRLYIISKGDYTWDAQEHEKLMLINKEVDKRVEQLGEIDFNS